MSRQYHSLTLSILKVLHNLKSTVSAQKLFRETGAKMPYKDFYNILFRLSDSGYVKKFKLDGELLIELTNEGSKLINRKQPTKDGVWKLVIFDIPEKQKYVRTVLRAKLKSLHFKKWQNSIWISPYALDEEIEEELKSLAEKFFIRLIKTTDINNTKDLEKIFAN